MSEEINLNNVLIIGGIALGGYALYRFFNKADDGIGGVASGVGTTATSVGNVAESTADAYSDVLSVTNPLKELTSGTSSLIKNTFDAILNPKGTATIKTSDYSTYTNTGSAIVKTNLFTNPTGQSIQPNDMSVYQAPLTVQNTVSLAKSSTSVKNVIGKSVPKTSSIAYKKGYIK